MRRCGIAAGLKAQTRFLSTQVGWKSRLPNILNNMVTHQTAVRLKAANFPQPAFAPLQWWYSPAEELLLACSFDKKPAAQSPYRFIDPSNPDYPDCWANLKSFCYAPTAAEILQSLGQKYVLWFDDSPKVLRWFCAETGDLPSEAGRPFGDSNPAEACAEAWIEINEQK